VSALAAHDGAERRRTNFFRDVTREPETSVALDALKEQALNLVRASLEADALENRRDLRPDDMDRMLSAARGKLRGMSERELRGISASSASLKTLTDYSLTAAPVKDLRSPAALAAAAAEREKAASVDGANGLAARLLRADMERAERLASGARYDGLSGDRLSQSDLQNMASARSAAISLGMPWALNNPELLKLGPAAIKTLHDAGVKQERFERLTGDKVGFRASTAVDIAAFAKRHNLSPEQTNALFDKISNGVEIISGGNKAIQRELDEATRKYVAGPDTPESRKALQDAYSKHATSPEAQQAAVETPKAIIDATQRQSAAVAQAEVKEVKAEDKVVKADEKVVKADVAVSANQGDLDDPPAKKADDQPAAAPQATSGAAAPPNAAPKAAPPASPAARPPAPK